MVVDDPRFAQTLRERLERAMAQGGKQVAAAEFAIRPRRQRVLELVAFAMMRVGLFLIGRRY